MLTRRLLPASVVSSLMLVTACEGQPPRGASSSDVAARPAQTAASPQSETRCTVTRIVDGDSFECGSAGRMRLIGVDAPELNQRPYGAQSRDMLAALMPLGTDVRLEYDVRPADPYSRRLAYVWDDAVLINEAIVRRGWALAERFPPNVRLQQRLDAAEQRAKDDRAGLWASGGFDCKPGDRRRRNC